MYESLNPIFQEEHEMVEELAEDLYTPSDSGVKFPKAWAVFQLDMSLVPEEDRKKVYQAELLLREAGIGFDAGSGGGMRDWELDWSLHGAFLKVRPIHCMLRVNAGPACENMGSRCFWTVINRNGEVFANSYCSAAHRQKDLNGERGEVLYVAESEIWNPSTFPVGE